MGTAKLLVGSMVTNYIINQRTSCIAHFALKQKSQCLEDMTKVANFSMTISTANMNLHLSMKHNIYENMDTKITSHRLLTFLDTYLHVQFSMEFLRYTRQIILCVP